MGTKDVCEKHLISLNDVFAEVWNFRSKVRIHPEALYEAPTEHITHAKHEYVHKYRDIFKYYRNELKLNIAVLGVENQTKPEKAMPAREKTTDKTQKFAENTERLLYKLPFLRYHIGD